MRRAAFSRQTLLRFPLAIEKSGPRNEILANPRRWFELRRAAAPTALHDLANRRPHDLIEKRAHAAWSVGVPFKTELAPLTTQEEIAQENAGHREELVTTITGEHNPRRQLPCRAQHNARPVLERVLEWVVMAGCILCRVFEQRRVIDVNPLCRCVPEREYITDDFVLARGIARRVAHRDCL